MGNELASIIYTVYNQEQYVRESLTCALTQSYEPLEIVVSDDGSSDGTRAVIDKVVNELGFERVDSEECGDSYLRAFQKGGKKLVVNFNVQNRGICENFEYAFGLTHGELVFTFGGDDISMPDRVERLMAAWIADGKRAKVLASGGWLMDVAGRDYQEYRREVLNGAPVGAFNAYARCVYDDFPRIDQQLAAQTYEDSVYGLRAQFFAPPLYVDELLVRYRFGSGVSTGGGYRRKMIRGARAVKASCEQLLKDLETLKGLLSEVSLSELRIRFSMRIAHEEKFLRLLDGRTTWERWSGYVACRQDGMTLKDLVIGMILVLPRGLGDWLLSVLQRGKG